MKSIAALGIMTLTIGCIQEPESRPRNATEALPSPLVIVGDATAGAIAAEELRADGVVVTTVFQGRALGLTAFCTGNADAMALTPGQDLTSAERDRCRAIRSEGWSWSALSTENGVGFYVRHTIARAALDAAPNAL
jgi:hypothetical protein